MKTNRSFIFNFLVFTIALALYSCTHDPLNVDGTKSNACDADTAYFVNDVLPLLQSSCAQSGCHDAKTAEHNVILDNYENIVETGKVKKGKASDSELYEVLLEKGDDMMPPASHGGPWDASKIALIKKWINQGALNNHCKESNCDTITVTFSSSIQPILATNCLGCHSYPNPQGNVNLQDYNGVFEQVSNKRLLGSLQHKNGFSAMPKGMDKLKDCEIRKIAIWINNGALND